MSNRFHWLIVRLVIAAAAVSSILIGVPMKTNLDYRADMLLGLIVFAFVHAWLRLNAFSRDVLTRPFSLDTAFFPMRTYPLRYWMTSSYICFITGITAVVKAAFVQSNLGIFGEMLLCIGAAMTLAVVLYVRGKSSDDRDITES